MSVTQHESEKTPGVMEAAVRSKLRSPSSPIDFRDNAEVLELVNSEDPLETASSLVQKVDETYFVLGGVLSHIKRHELHARAGYGGRTGFRDFCEEKLGYSYRKAQYLIDIYENVCRLELDVDRLREIGWGKAKELVKISRATNGSELLKRDFEELVTFAEGHNHEELVRHIKNRYLDAAASTGDDSKRRMTFRFTLFGEAAEIVDGALKEAMAEADTKNPSTALEHIVGEWGLFGRGLAHRSLHPPRTPEELVAYARDELGLEVQVVGRVEDHAPDDHPESLGQEVAEASTGTPETDGRKRPRVRLPTDLYN